MTEPTGPSPHLTWTELSCHDEIRTPYPLDWRASRAPSLARAFERVRAAAGGHPLKVLSAYRTPEWNKLIGGAEHSQHCQGRALDLAAPDTMSVRTFYSLIIALAPDTDIRYVEGYPEQGFVHLDVRPSAVLKQKWNG